MRWLCPLAVSSLPRQRRQTHHQRRQSQPGQKGFSGFCFKSILVMIFRNSYCGLSVFRAFFERILQKDLTTSLEDVGMSMCRAFATSEVLRRDLPDTSLFEVGLG